MTASRSLRLDAGLSLESIVRLSAELEREVASSLIDEKLIDRCWSKARNFDRRTPGCWLLLVRLAEAALLCAGNYADNCEYEAAGDLLVNPRQVLVHRIADGRPTPKNRHGRLSDQFGPPGITRSHFMKRFSAGVCLEITKPPLLPHMTQVLRRSKCISPSYIQRLDEGRHRIADTLAFLAAWQIFDSADLRRRLQATSERERIFVESHLCRFDTQIFDQIGACFKRSVAEPDYRSPFLAGPRSNENKLQHKSPATLGVLPGSPA
jgi:hypothetical protein